MKVKRTIRTAKRLVERALGIRILKKLPRGLDFIADIRSLQWPQEPSLILDVGANIGQFAIPLSESFQSAKVHCFEPSKDNYKKLISATRGNPNIISHQIAASSENGTELLAIDERAEMHRISSERIAGRISEVVRATTLDSFCTKNGIGRINILKIDTEGHDMEVLKGSANLLSENRIDVIQCEAGMNANNKVHTPFMDIHELLVKNRYLLFGLYEQTGEWIAGEPYLRRADVVFISPLFTKQSDHAPPATP